MQQNDSSRLCSSELANLWTQFQNDSMALCVNSYLLENCKDKEVTSILKQSISMSISHLKQIKEFLYKENYPTPLGFTKDDVNLEAPVLFSDKLILVYLQIMTLHGLNSYALCNTTSVRADQRKYYTNCTKETAELYDLIIDVMLNKGIFSEPPLLNPPDTIDFVENQNYLTGWFGKKRPLNAIEISGIHYNMQKTIVKVILEIGFSQVADSKEIREYFLKGVKICDKHLKELGELLTKDHLPNPREWTNEISNSTIAPFSDKLMLFHVISLVAVAVGYYGTALSGAQRRDVILKYTKLIGEIGLYAEDGINLLIKNKWMEQPPTVVDREALANRGY